MTLDFINKRIKEQNIYISDIGISNFLGEIDDKRYIYLLESAKSQLDYFEQKKKEHETTINI